MPAPSRRRRGLALLLALILTPGCQAIRLYAKDLLDPRASAAVTVPVRVAAVLFVLPPTIAWLPVSALPLALLQDEGAVWFALAPGLLLGGPFVLLFGTPGYLLTDRPPPESAARPAAAGVAPVATPAAPGQPAGIGSSSAATGQPAGIGSSSSPSRR